jgi:hypothetical protein
VSPDVRLQRWFEAPRTSCSTRTRIPMRNGHSGPGSSIGSWSPSAISVLEASGSSGSVRPLRPYVERNVFHTVERPHRLVYASTTESPDGSRVESLMEISLQWLERQTLLTLTQRGLPSGDIERGYIEGWNEFLDGFVARIQTRSAT